MMTRVKAIALLGLALGLSACNEDHPFSNGTPVGERCGSGPVEDFAGRAACRKGDTIETLKPADYCDFNYPLVTRSDAAFLASGAGVVSCVYVGELRKERAISAEEARTLVSDAVRARGAAAEAEARTRAEAQAQVEAARTQAREIISAAMVAVPAGSFQMGCSPGDSQCSDNEKPAHQVTISPFGIGKYEVTQAQWQAVMGENPSRFKGTDRPVENVSWNDVQEFLKRLNSKATSKPYRLPTEAEWEYAARAGTTTPYWWGKEAGKGNANCYGCGSQWDNQETAPVGSFKPNGFGLYDTAGNVWEWVQDCGHDGYTGAPAGNSGWYDNCQIGRVFRGGSWATLTLSARVSARDRNAPGDRYGALGLRLAQDL